MRGFIFTLEALIALMFFISIFSIMNALPDNRSELQSVVFLSDAFEVMEKGYRGDLSSFVSSGSVSASLSNYLSFIKGETGKQLFLKHGQWQYPSSCDPRIVITRMTTSYKTTESGRWHEIRIGLCQ